MAMAMLRQGAGKAPMNRNRMTTTEGRITKGPITGNRSAPTSPKAKPGRKRQGEQKQHYKKKLKSDGVKIEDADPPIRPFLGPCPGQPFWIVAQPYMADITKEDLDYLIAPIKKPWVPKIPPLGIHYREVWAEQDGWERPIESSSSRDDDNNLNIAKNTSKDLENNSSNQASSSDNPFDSLPLAERLKAALLNTNVLTTNGHHPSIQSKPVPIKPSPSQPSRDFGVRILQDLNSVGVVQHQTADDDQEDEIKLELEYLNAQHNAVCAVNNIRRQRLYARASVLAKKQALRRELVQAEEIFVRIYMKVLASSPVGVRKGHGWDNVRKAHANVKALGNAYSQAS